MVTRFVQTNRQTNMEDGQPENITPLPTMLGGERIKITHAFIS